MYDLLCPEIRRIGYITVISKYTVPGVVYDS